MMAQADIDRRQEADAAKYRKRAAVALRIIRDEVWVSHSAPLWQREADAHRNDPWYIGALKRQLEMEGEQC